jgi:hypothetical protein
LTGRAHSGRKFGSANGGIANSGFFIRYSPFARRHPGVSVSVEKPLELAKSMQADDLPGWCGPAPED